MRGGQAIGVVSGAIAASFLLAGAASYRSQARAADGPATVGEWAWRAVRPPGPLPTGRGAELIQHYGCRSCHTLHGTGAHVGPVLDGVRRRKTREEIIRWLDGPQRIKPGTKMPTFGFTVVEEQLLADFLLTQ